MPTRRQTLVSVITAALWQILPRPVRAADRSLTAFNAAFGERIALPALAQFQSATATLATAVQSLKQAPDAAGFAGMVQGFHDVSDAWMGLQFLRFGPLTQNQRLDQYSWVGRQARAWYYFDKPTGGADWGIRFGVTFVFPK